MEKVSGFPMLHTKAYLKCAYRRSVQCEHQFITSPVRLLIALNRQISECRLVAEARTVIKVLRHAIYRLYNRDFWHGYASKLGRHVYAFRMAALR